jgi:hypothetical protein
MRAHNVADVRRWLAAVLWRSRHAPTGEDQLAAISLKRTIGANWSGKIPETGQVAHAVMACAKPIADGCLALVKL